MPLWRPKRTRRLAASTVFGQLVMEGESEISLAGTTLSGGVARLPIGWWNYEDLIGTGPGEDFGAPIYTSLTDTSFEANELSAIIDKADQFDVLLVICPSGNRGQYTINGRFSRAAYETRTRRCNFTKFNNAVYRRRVLLLLGDEFNHPSFANTCSALDLNWMGNLHKKIWRNPANGQAPLTFVRQSEQTLQGGWDGTLSDFPMSGAGTIPPGFWTGLDYGWMQRSSQHNPAPLAEWWADGKALLATVNLGMVPGLNAWSGNPIKVPVDGISPCWDVRNNGTFNGLIGGDQADIGGVSVQYQDIACGSQADLNRAVTNPDWIRHIADVAAADPDAPFLSIWSYPKVGSSVDHSRTFELIRRADFVSAWNYAINKCNARPNFNGLRIPKPGVPV